MDWRLFHTRTSAINMMTQAGVCISYGPPHNWFIRGNFPHDKAGRSVAATSEHHYGDVIMRAIASQITSLTIVYSTVYSDADQRKHQSSASLAFVRGIHRGPVNSPHKWPVTRKMSPFDDVIMCLCVHCIDHIWHNWNTPASANSTPSILNKS